MKTRRKRKNKVEHMQNYGQKVGAGAAASLKMSGNRSCFGLMTPAKNKTFTLGNPLHPLTFHIPPLKPCECLCS